MYRDDDTARTERAIALIDEIAELERRKLASAAIDQRLETARHELTALQSRGDAVPQQGPGLVAHLLVFGASAAAAFVAYTVAF
jgi:hypothetical protein